jgi:hypothetical protein
MSALKTDKVQHKFHWETLSSDDTRCRFQNIILWVYPQGLFRDHCSHRHSLVYCDRQDLWLDDYGFRQ